MNHVRVMTTAGQEVEVLREELLKALHPHSPPVHPAHESNEHYQHRAYLNVCEAAHQHGIKNVLNTEKDMKELMSVAIQKNDMDMLGEIIEWFIADHSEKTGN